MLAGCEAEGPSFHSVQAPAAKAVVYVYRPYELVGSSQEPDITCGNDTTQIVAGGYHAFVADPGIIECYSQAAKGNRVSFEVRPATAYYVRETVRESLTSVRVELAQVDRSVGVDEIKSTRAPQ